ncbi:translation initiation factor 2 [Pseudomonas sp. Marseille-Q8238]
MRKGPLSLLVTTLLFAPLLSAEEVTATATPPGATASSTETLVTQLQQQLAESERLRNELQAGNGEQESALLSRLRQENQRLKIQLKQAQAQSEGPSQQLLSQEQMWFAVGGGATLLAFLVGVFSSGRRNKRHSQWV